MLIFDDFDGYHAKAGPYCMACEAMLADAVDETLGEIDRRWFDQHVGSCTVCAERFANAQRGSAWLELLKTSRPEPGDDLVARIMANTGEQVEVRPVLTPIPAAAAWRVPLIAFPHLVQPKAPWRMMLEPRMAMTAAMAFFSLALTMNLMGVRLNEVRASDLKPANLERSLDAAHNRAVQYYDGLRVVHVMESRVEGLKQANEDRELRDTGAGRRDKPSQSTPAPEQKSEPKDERKPGAGSGTSRRESPGGASSVMVAEDEAGGGTSVWTRSALLATVWEFNFSGGRV